MESVVESLGESKTKNVIDSYCLAHRAHQRKQKFRRNKEKAVNITQNSKQSKKSSIISAIIYIGLFNFIFFAISFIITIRCFDKFEPVGMKHILDENLFGQKNAVEHIVGALASDGSKLLIIYGGTGVGKTYAVSLLFSNSWNNSNVFYYTMPTSKDIFTSNTHWGSLVCRSVIFVIDGLGSTDLDIAEKIEFIFSISTNQNITVIIIYNCDLVTSNFKKACDTNFRTKLVEKFSSVNVAHKEFVKFESLSQEHLRQCIDKALNGYKINEDQYNNLLNNFNVDLDGCKGVEPKVHSSNRVEGS